MSMRHMIILLPGIMGSALQKDGKDLWALSGQALWRYLTDLKSTVKQLVLGDDDWTVADRGDGGGDDDHVTASIGVSASYYRKATTRSVGVAMGSMMLSTMDNWNNIIGDPANKYRGDYPQLEKLRQQYFRRLSGRINFRVFIDYLDFFDRSFIELVKKLLPARVDFQGADIVIESHMLERAKVQYTYRRQNPQLVPEGTIVIYGHAPLKTTSWA